MAKAARAAAEKLRAQRRRSAVPQGQAAVSAVLCRSRAAAGSRTAGFRHQQRIRHDVRPRPSLKAEEARRQEAIMSYSLIEATPSAYAYPLLIKSLLHTALINAPDQEIVYADRVRYDYRFPPAHRPAGERADRARHQAGRHGGSAGLGQPSLSRMLLRRAKHGRRAAHGECAAVTRADPLHDQSRRGRYPAGARRLPATAGRHQGSDRACPHHRPAVG